MNYSKNAKKKSDAAFKRLMIILITVFIIGILTGVLGSIIVDCFADDTPKVKASNEPEIIINTPEIESLGVFRFTAYCACSRCCGKSDGITATGTKATEGRTIAVDPKIIPLKSKVLIDGNEYIAEDVGGAIKGNRIDLYFDNHQEALDFGVQYKEVFAYVE